MSDKLARSAGQIGVATLLSRVLGLVRDVVQGYWFGTSVGADAFGVATRIPTLLRDLFAEGAMSAAFVPTFTRYLERHGRAAAWRLGALTINGLLVVTGAIVLLGIVFADQIVALYAQGYRDAEDAATLELTVLLTRVNMPFLTLVSVAAIFMGMLNALRQFFMPALSPALYNVCFILSTAILTPIFMQAGLEPTMSLSIGMLLGGLAQVAVQWPSLKRAGYTHTWAIDYRDPGVREVLTLMGPGIVGAAAAQINLLVNTALATSNVTGAVAGLQFAFRLMYLPIGIFSVSVATAAVPELARAASNDDLAKMRTTLSWALRLMLMLSVPATVGLMVLAGPIVQLIYQYGVFNDESTAIVASSLLFYAPGIVGYSVVKIAAPAFYSLKDARTPIIASVISVGTNLVLNLALNAVMGFRGLALGTAIAAIVNAALLLWLLGRRLDGLEGARVGIAFGKILLASGAMGVAAYVAQAGIADATRAIAGPSWTTALVRVSSVGGGIVAGLVTLAAAAWILRISEFRLAIERVRARIGR